MIRRSVTPANNKLQFMSNAVPIGEGLMAAAQQHHGKASLNGQALAMRHGNASLTGRP